MKTPLLALAALAALLGGCASTRSPTSDLGDAAVQPLSDFNLRRREIPPVLLAAAAAPYAPPRAPDCAGLDAEIGELDAVLGPDVDVPMAKGDARRQLAAEFATDALRDAATGWIPMRGMVRRVTGAESRAKLLRQAVLAGAVRRGYLRGLAQERGCPPRATEPAAPLR